MNAASAAARERVVRRADNRCEYCGLSQVGQEATFHVDHVVPRAAGGVSSDDNRALACVACSLHKAARRTARDPASGEESPLLNPRQQLWADHFEWDSEVVTGHTPTGRATLTLLRMNRPLILAIRREERLRSRHPPTRAD